MDYKKEWLRLRKRIQFCDSKLAEMYKYNCSDISSLAASITHQYILGMMDEAEGVTVRIPGSMDKLEEGFGFYEEQLKETTESIRKALENIHKLKTVVVGSKFMDV